MKQKLIVEIIAALFILLFVYAATSKLLDVQKFRIQLGQSPLLTDVAGLTAWLIPALEIVLALMLGISKWKLAALYGSFTIMILFTTYIIFVTNFSDYIPCSCGGILEKLSWNEHLVFNLSFAALAFTGILVHKRQPEGADTTIKTNPDPISILK